MWCGGGETNEEDTPFSVPFSSPTGFATMGNQAVSDAFVSRVLTTLHG